jgi:energy-coupling factor transporter ATP-binding protein EcfA2
MKLISAHATNFRSVLDSGEFTLGGTTCLVGKNESGKTTILQALERLNPLDQSKKSFNRDLEYPRGYLAEYEDRHGSEEAQVINTKWELDDSDVATVEGVLGPGALKSKTVEISKRYESENPTWAIRLDEPAIVAHMLSKHGVKTADKKLVSGSSTVLELRKKITAAGANASEELKALLAATEALSKGEIASWVRITLLSRLPKFLYFSSYDRMDGRVHVETLQQVKANGQQLKAGQQIFLDFLELAGTSLAGLSGSNTFEQLKARVEAASISISKQVFAYWSQNKNLKVEFSLEAGRPGDEAPYNTGSVMHTRIRNKLHDMTVPFDDRSAGFTWFFSFLVKFSQVKKNQGNVIILLDEPGLNLHAKAQNDLLRYFKEKLEPEHQVIYTTHSPFMVPTDQIMSVRTVEDVVVYRAGEEPDVQGTKVGDKTLSTDKDTLFPLQSALGYEITQSFFVGEHTLLVEGPSDLLYLQVFSQALKAIGRTHLNTRWTVCPAGGVDKVWAFTSLFGGNRLHVAALIDYAGGQKSNVEKLRKSQLLREGHVLLASDFCDQSEADIEDLLGEELYVDIVNNAYSVPDAKLLVAGALPPSGGLNQRTVLRVEAAMRLLPEVEEFDHFWPSAWLIRNISFLDATKHAVAFERFEALFKTLNALL